MGMPVESSGARCKSQEHQLAVCFWLSVSPSLSLLCLLHETGLSQSLQ